MKKVITALLILAMSVSLFTGCGKKESAVFTTEQFIDKMTELGYDTNDETDEFSSDYLGEGVKKATFVYDETEDLQFKFIELEDAAAAKLAYDDYRLTYELVSEKPGEESKNEKKDYCRIRITSEEWECQLVRFKNTLLIFQNPLGKTDAIQGLLKKIEYEK